MFNSVNQAYLSNISALFWACISQLFIYLYPDLEKVVNRPQVKKPKLYNVLKISGFTTMDEQKYMY